MDTMLEATPITSATGKGTARKLRATGVVPAVIYSNGGEATRVSVSPRALNDLFTESRNRNLVVKLQVAGQTIPAIVREVQRNPVSRDILHVDFYAVSDARPVEVMVPLNPVGRPKGAVIGGRIRLIRRELRARCAWDKIPATFDIDVTELDIGDELRASDLKGIDGVTVVYSKDFPILALDGKKTD